jgi:hypothetical protein
MALNWLEKPPKEGERFTCSECGVERMVTKVKFGMVASCEVKKKPQRWSK